MGAHASSQILVCILGSFALLMGQLARRAALERSQRMMCPATVIGAGTRWARRTPAWQAPVAYTLLLTGTMLLIAGILGAFGAGIG
jgi:hypothetical protein